MIRSHARAVVIFVLLIAFVVLILYSSRFEEAFFDLIELFKQNVEKNPLAAVVIFVTLNMLSAMFAPLSSVPLAPFAIATWGESATLLLFMTGWMMGGTTTYMLGKYAAHPFFRRLSIYQRIEAWRGSISDHSQFLFVLFFRAASPAEIPGYVLGSLRYTFWKYFFATFITELPIGLIAVYASQALLEKNIILFLEITAATVFALAVLFFFFQKSLKGKRV